MKKAKENHELKIKSVGFSNLTFKQSATKREPKLSPNRMNAVNLPMNLTYKQTNYPLRRMKGNDKIEYGKR